MKRFVFRAEAALVLRRKQEDEANLALAAAETRCRDARAALDAAGAALDAVLQRAGAQEAAGDLATSIWFRHWIAAQQQQVARCADVVREKEREVIEATRRAQLARRKARSLERFRDRAWARYVREEARQEQQALDELAASRFQIARTNAGGYP
jgi:flagellar export protein FliJ